MAGRKTRQEVVEVETLQPITPTQQKFIEHLLAGRSISDAALLAGISRRTATYWLHDLAHPVTIEYEKQAMQQRDELSNRLANIHGLAIKAIEDALSESAPPELRLKAAKFILESRVARANLPSRPIDLVESETKGMEELQHLDNFSAYHIDSLPD